MASAAVALITGREHRVVRRWMGHGRAAAEVPGVWSPGRSSRWVRRPVARLPHSSQRGSMGIGECADDAGVVHGASSDHRGALPPCGMPPW